LDPRVRGSFPGILGVPKYIFTLKKPEKLKKNQKKTKKSGKSKKIQKMGRRHLAGRPIQY